MSGSAAAYWAKRCEKCRHRYTWQGPMVPEPPCPRCNPESQKQVRNSPESISPEVHERLEQCEEILQQCADLPEAGEAFGESVTEKVQGIRDTISEKQFVTDKQAESLDNMQAGVERWFHD